MPLNGVTLHSMAGAGVPKVYEDFATMWDDDVKNRFVMKRRGERKEGEGRE